MGVRSGWRLRQSCARDTCKRPSVTPGLAQPGQEGVTQAVEDERAHLASLQRLLVLLLEGRVINVPAGMREIGRLLV
jgi:hypothetical protein